TSRSELAATSLDGRLYVGGGLGLTGASKAFEVYDVEGGTWQTVADLPESLHHFGLAALDEGLLVSGGYAGNTLSDATASTWIYDPAADSWSAGTPMPAARAAHAAVSLDGLVYVVGGEGDRATELWVYDPAADSWQTAPGTLPTAREHLGAAALDGKLYVVGGRRPRVGNLATLEIYDPATGAWERGPDMPTARGGITAAALDGRLHVAGGEDFNRSPSCTFDQHEVFDPATDRWDSYPDLPTPRHGLSGAVSAGRWYVIGGGTKAAALTVVSTSDAVEVYQP
ncbi:MAG: kelch repeat-containing protein, partial [Candidatus Promineifilaceae bacterium]|nr:kelch repeat-containing protein [Candidatus Promineifilaceae bacterium]